MKLYIAGPMTGLPEFNYPAFEAARAQLQAAGYAVICPTDNSAGLDRLDDRPWKWYMRRALRQVLEADAIAVLTDAACSKGALLECHVALSLGMPVRSVDAWLEDARVEATS